MSIVSSPKTSVINNIPSLSSQPQPLFLQDIYPFLFLYFSVYHNLCIKFSIYLKFSPIPLISQRCTKFMAYHKPNKGRRECEATTC